MPEVFRALIYTHRKALFSHLQSELNEENAVELFYLTQLREVAPFIERIKPNAVVVYVDEDSQKCAKTIEIIEKSQSANPDLWILAVLHPKLSEQNVKKVLSARRLLILKDADDNYQIANNLKFIRNIDNEFIREADEKSHHINLNTCLNIIYGEKTIPKIQDRLLNFLPKLIMSKYLAMFTVDRNTNHILHFNTFKSPIDRQRESSRNYQTDRDAFRSLMDQQFFDLEESVIKADSAPNLFKQLDKLGWSIKKLHILPTSIYGMVSGGILIGFENDNLKPKEIIFLKAILHHFNQRVLELQKSNDPKEQNSEYVNSLWSEQLDIDSILTKTCVALKQQTNVSSVVYWQMNPGFGFIFSKFDNESANGRTPVIGEKTFIFLDKDPFLASIFSKSKEEQQIFNADTNELFKESTREIFKKIKYNHLYFLPVTQGEKTIGAFVLNNSRNKNHISIGEIQKAKDIINRSQTMMNNAYLLKEVQTKINQLQGVFDFSKDLLLSTGLEATIEKICNNIRKQLHWNDVAVILKKTETTAKTIFKLGFERTPELPISLEIGVENTVQSIDSFLEIGKKESKSFLISTEKNSNLNPSKNQNQEWRRSDLLIIPLEILERNQKKQTDSDATKNGSIKQKMTKIGYLLLSDPVDRLRPNTERLTTLEYYASQIANSAENSMLYNEINISKERYRTLTETMTLALVTCNRKGKITYCNSAMLNLLGYSSKRILGRNVQKFIEKDHRLALRKMVKPLLKETATREVENRELVVISKNNEEIPVNVYAFPFREQNNETGFFMILNDLRVIKKLERMRADFNSMIVHDLRSPMNVIQGFIELIRNEIVGNVNEEQVELLDIVKENAKKVLALVDNFLVASRLEVGKFSIELKMSEINSLVNTQTENHKVLTKNKKIEIISELDDNLPVFMFDKMRIDQVLNNLLSNALKFTPENGQISVTTHLHREEVEGNNSLFARVSVKDNGIGIPEDKLANVFEKYEQVDANQQYNIRGTGLGLSICKEIIELHNGRIWAESQVEGGSTFSFIIPIQQQLETMV